jgi:hypothetical protein
VHQPGQPPATAPAATARTRELEDEREIRKAARARDAACATIAAGPLPAPDVLARILAAALLDGTGYSETLRLACKWLRDAGIAPPGADHYAWRGQLAAAGDHKGLARYAYTYALAADELHARARHHPWGDRHAAHLARLADTAGYQPTAWEQARLDEASQTAAARGTLSCPDCGCICAPGPDGCDVKFDRKAGKPVYECHWDCKTHKPGRDAARAFSDHRRTGASTDDETEPAEPNGPVWTPDLRAALEGLMR